MPDTPSITLVKEFTYRGQAEEWSNTYHFVGDTPGNPAEWETLARAIWVSERTVLSDTNKLVQAYGYQAGSEISVAQVDFRPGSQTGLGGGAIGPAGGQAMAGDQALWVRAFVGLSATGKKVYVRKYYHGSWVQNGSPDLALPAMKTALLAHAAVMLGGTLPGDAVWSGPQGAIPIQPKASDYVTTRTLKRRGKRP